MANPVVTAIGRVQPKFKGDWSSVLPYEKLDNVLYGGSTYIALQNVPAGITPGSSAIYWQLIASKGDSIKGDTGSFGTPTASAHDLAHGEDPTVAVTASGPDDAKIFAFEFGLPAGPTAFDPENIEATATTLQAGSQPTVTAEIDNNILSFEFGIPSASGSGAQSVDGVTPAQDPVTGLQNVTLNAVRAVQGQQFSDLQKQYIRQNLNVQEAGNYQPAGDYIEDPGASTGQFLRFSNEGEWVGESINLVPTGAASDVGKYLRKSANGMIWADVQSLPAGGSEGAPLIKNSVDNYDVTWGTFISNSEIDDIIDN